MEKPKVASRLKARLRGKSIKIILCDVVLQEVRRVRGYTAEKVIAKISKLLGRKIGLSKSDEETVRNATQISNQYSTCHCGDNKILSLCQAKNFVLVTFDRMLLKTSQFVGVPAFHPMTAGGI
jgi:predicted nucleic acid-binding protein